MSNVQEINDMCLAMTLQKQDWQDQAQNIQNSNNKQYATRHFAKNVNASTLSDEQKQELEDSRMIILPPSDFEALSRFSYPHILCISNLNRADKIKTYVGIKNYTSTAKVAILPDIIMKYLRFDPNAYDNQVVATQATLNKATKIVFQPHKQVFIQQKQHLLHIRSKLSKLACLSVNDIISVN